MVMRIGIVAIAVAIGFAVGTFFGREFPSDSGAARWFKQQPGVEQALQDLSGSMDELNKFFATPTPTPGP